jgi:1-deoxy-D-xylulose 5-phosphate reductoisomerase
VDLQSGIEELKRRLEVLLGAVPEAPLDESMKAVEEQLAAAAIAERKERMAAAGGQLLGSAFAFLKELIPADADSEASLQVAATLKQQFEKCLSVDAQDLTAGGGSGFHEGSLSDLGLAESVSNALMLDDREDVWAVAGSSAFTPTQPPVSIGRQ